MVPSLLLLLAFAGTASAQSDVLRAEIRAAYAEGDLLRARDFFAEVMTKPNLADYVEALRAELEDRSNSSRMRVDGSARLLILSNTAESRILAARVLARADFRESGIASYYAVARRLADRNVDISLAAFRLLEQPDVRMNWVADFSFDQASLVASLLLATDEKYWADAAIERLSSEEDQTAQYTLLRLLWYAQSDFADGELAAFAANSMKPASSRALAEELLAREPNISAFDRAEVLAASEEDLHERRRQRQTALPFRNIMPTMERDTMKILLKRRLASADR